MSSIITCIFPGTRPQCLSLPDPALVYFKSLYIGPPLPPPPTRGTSWRFGAGTAPRSACQEELARAAAARADGRCGATATWGAGGKEAEQRWLAPQLSALSPLAPAAPLSEGPVSFPSANLLFPGSPLLLQRGLCKPPWAPHSPPSPPFPPPILSLPPCRSRLCPTVTGDRDEGPHCCPQPCCGAEGPQPWRARPCGPSLRLVAYTSTALQHAHFLTGKKKTKNMEMT